MKLPRIALLTNLDEEVSPHSTGCEPVFAYELAAALLQSARDIGGIEVDVVARKAANTGLPLVSIDTSGLEQPGTDPLSRFAWQDAVYSQLIMGGMLNGYTLVHCLAQVVTPLLMLAANGVPVVQTLTALADHPSATLPPKLITHNFRQVTIGPYVQGKDNIAIPPSVDLMRFRPVDEPAGNFIFFTGDKTYLPAAKEIANASGLSLHNFKDGDAEHLTKHAAVVLHLADDNLPCDTIWLMRAIACGTPVAAFASPLFSQLFRRPELGIFVDKDAINSLISGIKKLPARNEAATIRREYAVGLFSQRSQAARYRELYKTILIDAMRQRRTTQKAAP